MTTLPSQRVLPLDVLPKPNTKKRRADTDFGAALDHLAGRAADINALSAALPEEKWLLASHLQKTIRRGKGDLAAATAMALARIDLGYIARRLPVIAYEDIGVANPALLVLVKKGVGALPLESTEDAHRTLAALASMLASSPKSRTACDLLSLIPISRTAPEITAYQRQLRRADLVALAVDREAPTLDRVLAFNTLMTARRGTGGAGNPTPDDRNDELAALCARMNVPTEIHSAVIQGGGTYDLNRFLPLAHELVFGDGPCRTVRSPPSKMDGQSSGALLLCSLDMYTRVGRSAYVAMLKTSEDLQAMLRICVGRQERIQTLGILLFHLEGSVLDRYFASSASTALLHEVESLEARRHGLSDLAAVSQVRNWLLRNPDQLALARRFALEKALIPTFRKEH